MLPSNTPFSSDISTSSEQGTINFRPMESSSRMHNSTQLSFSTLFSCTNPNNWFTEKYLLNNDPPVARPYNHFFVLAIFDCTSASSAFLVCAYLSAYISLSVKWSTWVVCVSGNSPQMRPALQLRLKAALCANSTCFVDKNTMIML